MFEILEHLQYTGKTLVTQPLKKRQYLMTNGSLMKVESIARP